jgi:hypothetical protein
MELRLRQILPFGKHSLLPHVSSLYELSDHACVCQAEKGGGKTEEKGIKGIESKRKKRKGKKSMQCNACSHQA